MWRVIKVIICDPCDQIVMRLQSSAQLLSAIALIGALSLMTGMPLMQPVSALPLKQPSEILKRQNTDELPRSLSEAILEEAAQQSNVPQSSLRIVQAEKRTWNNGCLGLASPGMFCTQALVPGWHVRVEGKAQGWIYRTDETGSVIKLERSTKSEAALKPVRMSEDELPGKLGRRVIFRAIATGGFAGQTSETQLLRNGQMIHQRLNLDGTTTPLRKWRISAQQVRQFQTLLKQEGFDRFDHLSYPASPGSADFLTVTLTSPTGTVQYSDSNQSQLPPALQTIIKAWDTLR